MADDVAIADPEIGDDAVEAVADVVSDGQLAAGEEVRAFESEFADYCGADHAVATANGTTALHAALEAAGVGPGDHVVTTPFSFVATANAIRFAGAMPEFVDVDPETYNLDPHAVEQRVRSDPESVDAILAVHLFGLPARMDHLADVADTYDLTLVEDAAQAHGAEFAGESVGTLGDVAAFSFYPTKNMTTGEGGMITTDDGTIADAAARFINHGRETDGYEHVELGHNFRMTDVAAVIGREQLDRLPSFNSTRRRNAIALDGWLEQSPLVTPTEPPERRHVYHQYTVRCGNRGAVRSQLEEYGIGTGVYYPCPIPDLEAFDSVSADCGTAARLSEEVFSLPVHPGVSEDSIDHIGRVLTEEVTVEDV